MLLRVYRTTLGKSVVKLQYELQPTYIRRCYKSQLNLPSKHDFSEAREWMSKFQLDIIPKRICEVSFSRSSGPGGQNVNKVNTKASLRVSLDDLCPLVPSLLHPYLRDSRYYASKSNSLIIHADNSRKQNENMDSCFARLHDLIVDVGAKAIPGETSVVQQERVKAFQRAYNERRLQNKKFLSSKKASRRSSGRGDD